MEFEEIKLIAFISGTIIFGVLGIIIPPIAMWKEKDISTPEFIIKWITSIVIGVVFGGLAVWVGLMLSPFAAVYYVLYLIIKRLRSKAIIAKEKV